MPSWVRDGCEEYLRRVRSSWQVDLIEVSGGRGSKSIPARRQVAQQGERMLAAVPRDAVVVALDERGDDWSTQALARHLAGWRDQGQPVACLIGGADGLAEKCLSRATARWSLSRLTLPHGLARVVVSEQIYRAWSVLNHHPYHRD